MEASYLKTDKLMFDFVKDENTDEIMTIASILDKLSDEAKRAGFKKSFNPTEIKMINDMKQIADEVVIRIKSDKRAIIQP